MSPLEGLEPGSVPSFSVRFWKIFENGIFYFSSFSKDANSE